MDLFLSYAQNCEDVMLWRALRHIDRGFYIDAGAAEPEIDSVTCAFYQRGWTGMNVEPSPGTFARLASARPRDINLQVALGNRSGEADFFLVDGGNGLSTLVSSRRAGLQAEGRTVESRPVRLRRLADLCQEHAVTAIHFLKIDVEGAEREVIDGAALHTWRPWIVLVEATQPNSTVSAYEGWEPLLLSAGYRFVYADGVNRFYLASEHEDLADAFSNPPNFFDHYMREAEWRARRDAETLYQQVLELDGRLSQSVASAAQLTEQCRHAEVERDAASQELWESNRLVGVLSAERQSLIDQVNSAAWEQQKFAEALKSEKLTASADYPEQLADQLASFLDERRAMLKRLKTAAEDHRRLAQAEDAATRLVAALHRSTSWRVTAPLRLLKRGKS